LVCVYGSRSSKSGACVMSFILRAFCKGQVIPALWKTSLSGGGTGGERRLSSPSGRAASAYVSVGACRGIIVAHLIAFILVSMGLSLITAAIIQSFEHVRRSWWHPIVVPDHLTKVICPNSAFILVYSLCHRDLACFWIYRSRSMLPLRWSVPKKALPR
jgi:hypothetical protein